jgi:hypothetical protein
MDCIYSHVPSTVKLGSRRGWVDTDCSPSYKCAAASQTHTRHVHAATPAALPLACCGSTTAHGAAQRWLRREKCFKLSIRLRRLWLLAMTCSSTFVQWFCLSVLRLTQSSLLITVMADASLPLRCLYLILRPCPRPSLFAGLRSFPTPPPGISENVQSSTPEHV